MKDYGRLIEEVYNFVSLNFSDMAFISLNQSTYDHVKQKMEQKKAELKSRMAIKIKVGDFLQNIIKAKHQEEERERELELLE